MNKKIFLPHGGNNSAFYLYELVDYFKNNKLPFMIIGNTHVSLKKHKKKDSFDMWLRNHSSLKSNAKNTCQAVNSVINNVISSGLFNIEKHVCPITRKKCRALVYVRNN